MNTPADRIEGSVEKLLFYNAHNGFAVLLVHVNAKTQVTVRGYFPQINPGEQITAQGTWTMHSKFGKQFEVTHFIKRVPTSILGIKKYLSSGLIKGIGPAYATRLMDRFGADVLRVLDETPERLHEVAGIGAKRVQSICNAWEEQRSISHIMIFLQEKNISPTYAAKIYKKYGNRSIERITENPYRLAEDIWGIGFKMADQVARTMGFAENSVKRIRSGILYYLGIHAGSGNLYAELNDLRVKTCQLLELELETITDKLKTAFHELHQDAKIKVVTVNAAHYVALSTHYGAEFAVAQAIKRTLQHSSKNVFEVDTIHTLLEKPNHIALSDQQKQGIITALTHKITIITGGPGTGKTTLIRMLLDVLDAYHCRYVLAAPTGRAAKRMSEGTGRHAVTLHRLLEFDVSTMQFIRNEQKALETDFIIIDESSMLDIFLSHNLLKAMPGKAQILFIGDSDQLPSVGPGNFLRDLIESNAIPCVRLNTIFRQAQESLIVVNAHRINNGEFPLSSAPNTNRDYRYIKEESADNLIPHLENIILKGLPTYRIDPKDLMILVPMNKGSVGTQRLNHELQKILNPGLEGYETVQYAGTSYRTGDRVMQIRNNYDKDVFNGDIGTITEISLATQTIVITFLDRAITYKTDELDEIVLAYAITIHKSQGSEYKAIVVPLFMHHFTMLQKNLIYTAITRAKKLCIFIGQPKAIAMAITNKKGSERTTLLQQFLTSDITAH